MGRQRCAPFAHERDPLRGDPAILENIERVAHQLEPFAPLKAAKEDQLLGFDQITGGTRGALVRHDDLGKIHNIGLHKDVVFGDLVADVIHKRDQMRRPANHRIRQLHTFLFCVGGQNQLAPVNRLHLIVAVPDVGRRRLDQKQRLGKGQPHPFGHQRIDQPAAPFRRMHHIKRLGVAQPFVGGHKPALPFNRSPPHRAGWLFQIVQRHTEFGKMFDPVFRRFILHNRAL